MVSVGPLRDCGESYPPEPILVRISFLIHFINWKIALHQLVIFDEMVTILHAILCEVLIYNRFIHFTLEITPLIILQDALKKAETAVPLVW